MSSYNEWGTLKKIIVGIADDAKQPEIDKSVRTVNHADKKDINDIFIGNYPQSVIDEANEDLETLCEFLKQESVTVLRPISNNPKYYNYCPRDSVLVYGDTQYATPMPIQCRKEEYKAFQHHLENLKVCSTNDYNNDNYDYNCLGNPYVLALTEKQPLFDAANIIRANDNLLYLNSNSGNNLGAKYLQSLVGNSAKIRVLKDVYSYMHIDSTIAFLKEGLLLANPKRIKNHTDLPYPFCNWKIIWCPEPKDIGHYPGICNASEWINMNLLSVHEKLVILEENQHSLRIELEKNGIECCMLPMRHQRTLGGGFHCVTLDLERK